MKTKKWLHKIATMGLSCLLLAGVCLTGCGDSTGGNANTSFTWWISQGADASYYENYKDNPSIKYLLSKPWGENDTMLEFDFFVPVAGAQQDNFVTLLNSGEYTDVMEMTYFRGSLVELYESGTILDLTPYVEQYMPNYKAWLERYPDLALTATNTVDGEKKYLQIFSYSEHSAAWGGYMYRRDWIIKYGENPNTGAAFSGEYTVKNEDGSWNMESWQDDVVFPSGNDEPIYISDWEWMLDIFSKAIDDLGITDGYPMSLYYPGYMETGDLVSAFGGGSGSWYKTPENEIVYGPTSDNFRVYLQAMNQWYQNGWIDTAFPEHASDMIFSIDDAKVRQGKVGLWYGLESQTLNRMAGSDPLIADVVVFGAKPPINDIYGTAAQQNVEPYCMYQTGMEGIGYCVTDKAAEKDLPALFSFIDYLYSLEGMLIKTGGLNEEQMQEAQDSLYLEYGLDKGARYLYEENGVDQYILYPTVADSASTFKEALQLTRMPGVNLTAGNYIIDAPVENVPDLSDIQKVKWEYYVNTGWLNPSFIGQLTPEQNAAYASTAAKLTEFLSKNVPNFVKGTQDPNSDTDWTAFVNAVNKYDPDANTKILQDLLTQMTQ